MFDIECGVCRGTATVERLGPDQFRTTYSASIRALCTHPAEDKPLTCPHIEKTAQALMNWL